MPLDRPHLELLAAIAAEGRLHAAAERISLSPSAASRRLAEAERRSGTALTTQQGRNLVLTPAGRVLADAAERMLRELDHAEIAARWLGGGPERRTRVGLGFHDRLIEHLPEPGTWELIRLREDETTAALGSGRVDVVVTLDAGSARGAAEIDDVLVALVPTAAARDTSWSAGDFVPFRYYCSSLDPRPGFELDRFFQPAGCAPERVLRIESLDAVARLIAAGHGCSIQPAAAARTVASLPGLTIASLDKRIPVRWTVEHDGRAASAAVAAHVSESMRAAVTA